MAYTQRKYTESDAVKKFREQMEAQTGAKPADYASKWQPQIDSTVDSILNRKDFQYDVNADALYKQYKDRYVDLGQKAMMDTMGQAAKLTGGYGNSYAQMAGQQAYQSYLQGLTDKIPELYQLAYDRYNQQGADLYQRYGLLNTQEQNAFNQWQNAYNRWLAEREYAAGRYDTERGYDYGQYRDTVGDDQWKAQFDEDLRRYNLTLGGSGGGGGGYSGSGGNYYAPGPGNSGSGNFAFEAAAEALESGMNAVYDNQGNVTGGAIPYINSEPNATARDKNIALENAQGVGMTQHYQNLLDKYYKK